MLRYYLKPPFQIDVLSPHNFNHEAAAVRTQLEELRGL